MKEFAREAEQQHVATFGLTEVVQALDTSNQVFVKEQKSRNKLRAEYVTGVAKSARLEFQK